MSQFSFITSHYWPPTFSPNVFPLRKQNMSIVERPTVTQEVYSSKAAPSLPSITVGSKLTLDKSIEYYSTVKQTPPEPRVSYVHVFSRFFLFIWMSPSPEYQAAATYNLSRYRVSVSHKDTSTKQAAIFARLNSFSQSQSFLKLNVQGSYYCLTYDSSKINSGFPSQVDLSERCHFAICRSQCTGRVCCPPSSHESLWFIGK